VTRSQAAIVERPMPVAAPAPVWLRRAAAVVGGIYLLAV
jgi:hypothetical protein